MGFEELGKEERKPPHEKFGLECSGLRRCAAGPQAAKEGVKQDIGEDGAAGAVGCAGASGADDLLGSHGQSMPLAPKKIRSLMPPRHSGSVCPNHAPVCPKQLLAGLQ